MAILFSCQKDNAVQEQSQQVDSLLHDPFADIPRLENPYSVKNMKKALESLKSNKGKEYTNTKINTTHYYIKFTPRNEKEFDILKSDSLLILYNHPLDVKELIIPKTVAINNNLEVPPVMWCAVTVDHKLPKGCPYKILEDLYIKDEIKIKDDGKQFSHNLAFEEELVEESMRLTGNLEENTETKSEKKVSWRPAGTIKSWDDNITATGSFIGVEGVEVRARRWFTTHKGKAKSS